MNGDFRRKGPDEQGRRWKMSLADGIVREFRSGIISSLVPPPNPPRRSRETEINDRTARTCATRTRRWSKSVDRRYVPLVPSRWRHEFLCASEKSFSECSCNRNIDFGSRADFPQTLACREVHFHGAPGPRFSKSDCSDSSFMWIAYAKYLKLAIRPIDGFEGGRSYDRFVTLRGARYWLQWTIRVHSSVSAIWILRTETRSRSCTPAEIIAIIAERAAQPATPNDSRIYPLSSARGWSPGGRNGAVNCFTPG